MPKIHESVVPLICEQITLELNNARFYWECYEYMFRNYANNFASFYKEQAHDEISHFEKSLEHLVKRGRIYDGGNIVPPKRFLEAGKTPIEIFWEPLEAAAGKEHATTEIIKKIIKAADEVHDYATVTFYEDMLLNQVEEEYEFHKLMRMVDGIIKSGNTGVLYSTAFPVVGV